MERRTIVRIGLLAGGFLAFWLILRYLLPIFIPFLLGLLLALSAEPAVQLFSRLKLPRRTAAGLGVGLTLLLLITLVWLLGAAAVKELSVLAGKLPDLQNTAQLASDKLRLLLTDAADAAPEGVRPLIHRSVSRLFSSGSALMEQATIRLPGALTAFLSRVPNGALSIGAGILSGFMFSVRLSKLKSALQDKIPENIHSRLFPMLRQSKNALLGWLKAQCKLAAITYGIVAVGFLLLRIPLGPLWALPVALVDAVPLLGTGAILLPWALVCLLQHQHLRAVGLLCIYVCAVLTRTTLEPRLVGRHLGIDPLVTLVFLYLGYRFWGFAGMLLAPVLVAAITAATKEWKMEN